MPLYLRPFLYFSYRYFLRLGFLDGKKGFVFHFLQSFWYRLLVDIKIEQLREGKSVRAVRVHNEGAVSRQSSVVRGQWSVVQRSKSKV